MNNILMFVMDIFTISCYYSDNGKRKETFCEVQKRNSQLFPFVPYKMFPSAVIAIYLQRGGYFIRAAFGLLCG